MKLTLEITEAPSGMPSVRQRTFQEAGGRIGRDKSNDWVLPHAKVSSRHAVISYRSGVFYIVDHSRNGVFLNSTTHRLTPGQPQALQSGDCLYIEPYEIQVSVVEETDSRALPSRDTLDPFSDPFMLTPAAVPRVSPSGPRPDDLFSEVAPADGEVDPLKVLGVSGGSGGGQSSPASGRPILRADELERRPGLAGHYQTPAVIYPTPAPTPPGPPAPAGPSGSMIPAGYNPLEDSSVNLAPATPPSLEPAPVVASEPPPAPPPPAAERRVLRPEPAQRTRPSPAPPAPQAPPPAPAADSGLRPTPVPAAEPRPDRPPGDTGSTDLTAVLAAAGVAPVAVTPELAENFGRILRIVVGGVVDLLRARQRVKDALRMEQTQYGPQNNNPLKRSINAEDALHDLFVKRNPAYLAPLEAFEEAFADLSDHQVAMLAGLRVGFEKILAEFDPARFKSEVDGRRGRFDVMVPAEVRYWEAYRARTERLLQDVDATFRNWFGEEFVKAYEEQLERLDAERRSRNS